MNVKLDSLASVVGDVSRETFERLEHLETFLTKWAMRINLVSRSTLPQLWERHVLDSAQLLPIARGANKWIDLGSGSGFPGLVVATFLRPHDGSVVLVESNLKKAAFLRTAIVELALPARVEAARIEDVRLPAQPPDIVSARALAPLPQLLELSYPLMGADTRAVFHKGRGYAAEVRDSLGAWDYQLTAHPSRTQADSVILEISHVRKR